MKNVMREQYQEHLKAEQEYQRQQERSPWVPSCLRIVEADVELTLTEGDLVWLRGMRVRV